MKIILESQYGAVTSIAAHPKRPFFVIGSVTGVIQLWNYKTKVLITSRKFEVTKPKVNDALKTKPQIVEMQILEISSMAYSNSGNIIGIGFSNGSIKILDSETLKDYHENVSTTNSPPQAPFPYKSRYTDHSMVHHTLTSIISVSNDSISFIAFSECEQYMAIADEAFGVSVLHREAILADVTTEVDGYSPPKKQHMQWVLMGRNQAHFQKIVGLMFIPSTKDDDKEPRLISASSDRHIAEFDVINASIATGFKLKSLHRIEQSAHPLSVILHPNFSSNSDEQFLLTVNSEFKFKIYNAATRFCRKTVLGPTYGGKIDKFV